MIAVKKVALDELPVLLVWREKVLREVFSLDAETDVHDLIAQNRTYYMQSIPDGKHIACFAYQDDEIIGCGGLCLYNEMPSPDNANGKCGYLMNIYVLPEYRKHGAGKKIVTFLIEQARAENVGKIYLESTDGAKQFYRELGFSDLQGFMKV